MGLQGSPPRGCEPPSYLELLNPIERNERRFFAVLRQVEPDADKSLIPGHVRDGGGCPVLEVRLRPPDGVNNDTVTLLQHDRDRSRTKGGESVLVDIAPPNVLPDG